ncbi:hypothetical protein BKA93DRAFT_805349 [Sparassis latifolia]
MTWTYAFVPVGTVAFYPQVEALPIPFSYTNRPTFFYPHHGTPFVFPTFVSTVHPQYRYTRLYSTIIRLHSSSNSSLGPASDTHVLYPAVQVYVPYPPCRTVRFRTLAIIYVLTHTQIPRARRLPCRCMRVGLSYSKTQ